MDSFRFSSGDVTGKGHGGGGAGGADASGAEPSGSDGPRIVRSEDLLAGHREIWIEHGDQMYRLRLTASGKLYLSK